MEKSTPVDNTKRPTSLSETLWDFSWDNYFPFTIPGTEITARITNYDICRSFAEKNYANLFQVGFQDSPFRWFEKGTAKDRFYSSVMDFIGLCVNDNLIGFFAGNAMDWSSYYLRTFGILETYQRQGAFREFLRYICECLKKVGVHRALGEVSVGTPINIHTFNKLGFFVNGHLLSERWGAVLVLTKILNSDLEQVFEKQFCIRGRSAEKHASFY